MEALEHGSPDDLDCGDALALCVHACVRFTYMRVKQSPCRGAVNGNVLVESAHIEKLFENRLMRWCPAHERDGVSQQRCWLLRNKYIHP